MQELKAAGENDLFGDPWQVDKGLEGDDESKAKKLGGVPPRDRVQWEAEEEQVSSVASSSKESAAAMLTVSKEELAQMVAKMVQNHVQAAQQKEMTEEDQHKPSEAQAQEEEPKGKGLNKMVTKKITWTAEVKEPEGRSTSPQLEALTQENDQLKKTIKRIRSIMEKRDKGVEAITTKIQEARVKVEVAIKEWGKEEDELAGFLNKVHKEVEETMVQEGLQDDLEEEEDNLQDVVSLVGDTEYELFEGEIPDEVKQFIAHNKEGDTLGHEISMLEVTSPPRISQKHNRKIIGAMAYVLRRPDQYQMVSFSGWTPIGGLYKAMTDGNAFKNITCTVDVAILTQVGLFASTQGGGQNSL